MSALFQAAGLADAKTRLARFVSRWAKDLPEAVTCLREGFPAATAYFAFPPAHWRRLRTTNSLERLHGEIKRRTRAVGAFPDRASAVRLIKCRDHSSGGSLSAPANPKHAPQSRSRVGIAWLEDDMVITEHGAELFTPQSQSLEDPFAGVTS